MWLFHTSLQHKNVACFVEKKKLIQIFASSFIFLNMYQKINKKKQYVYYKWHANTNKSSYHELSYELWSSCDLSEISLSNFYPCVCFFHLELKCSSTKRISIYYKSINKAFKFLLQVFHFISVVWEELFEVYNIIVIKKKKNTLKTQLFNQYLFHSCQSVFSLHVNFKFM